MDSSQATGRPIPGGTLGPVSRWFFGGSKISVHAREPGDLRGSKPTVTNI